MSAVRETRERPRRRSRPVRPAPGARLERGADASRRRVLDGSLVSVDISGFTALAERLAARRDGRRRGARRAISAVFDGLIDVAERHGGDVLKFRGDALLLLFRRRPPRRARRGAASDMQWTIESMAGRRRRSARSSCGCRRRPLRRVPLLPHARSRTASCSSPGRPRRACSSSRTSPTAGEIVLSAETAAEVDPAWLAGARRRPPDDALEPGASTIPPPRGRRRPRPPRVRPARRCATTSPSRAARPSTARSRSRSSRLWHRRRRRRSRPRSPRSARHARRGVGDACETYGLTWLESDIDVDAIKLYLTGGAPSTSGQDEEGMVRALRDIVAADVGLSLRAGVNRGHVFTGDIGSSTRRTYAVMGDAVNLAARLTARAAPGEILATADVLDRARTTYATEMEPLLVKGKEAAILAHTVGEPIGSRRGRRLDATPIVGRERGARRRSATRSDARGCASCSSSSSSASPASASRGSSPRCARSRSGSSSSNVAGEQYATASRSLPSDRFSASSSGITPDSTARAGRRSSSRPSSDPCAPDLAAWLPLLAIPFDAEVDPTPEVDALDPAARGRRHETVETFLERILMMPTLLVVEDVHWLDDASRSSSRTSWPSRAAAVARLRDEPPGVAALAGHDEPVHAHRARAARRAAAAELALGVATSPLSAETLAALVARSGGNPLFVRELVVAAPPGSRSTRCRRRSRACSRRMIDTLDPADRMLLRYAAVVGPTLRPVARRGDPRRRDRRRLPVGCRRAVRAARGRRRLPVPSRPRPGHGVRGPLLPATPRHPRRVGDALERRRRPETTRLRCSRSTSTRQGATRRRGGTRPSPPTVRGRLRQRRRGGAVRARARRRGALDSVPEEERARLGEALGDTCERFADYARERGRLRAGDRGVGGRPADVARLGKIAALEERGGVRRRDRPVRRGARQLGDALDPRRPAGSSSGRPGAVSPGAVRRVRHLGRTASANAEAAGIARRSRTRCT